MGLDMYLEKRTDVRLWNFQKEEEQFEVIVKKGGVTYPKINPKNITTVVEEAGYWRKANAIHRWFVENVQDGKDDCGEYFVPPSSLELEVRRFYSAATIDIITSSLNAQYFIGDGITTQYSLTRSVSNDYDVLVSFDGLIQKPTYDYTITGSTLNFSTPPPYNIDGEIRYLMGSTTGLVNNNTSSYAVTSSYVNTLNQIVVLSQVSSSLNFINDAAAALGGVPLGGLYRNGNVIQIRLV